MKKLTESELADLMSFVPQYEDYENWLKVIAATLALADGNESLAESLLNGWQAEQRAGLYRQKLRSFRGGSRGAGWLVNEAKACGWQWPEREQERKPSKPLTVSKPLTIRSGIPKFYCDGAFYKAANADGVAVTIWVPAEFIGKFGMGDAVICHGHGTKRRNPVTGGVDWTFWAKKAERLKLNA